MNIHNTDILVAGSGCSGLFFALNIPAHKHITIITKSDTTSSDSFLAQGGICMLKDESDYESYFEDTLKAGRYENDKKSVDIMIHSSPEIIHDLINFGVNFQKDENNELLFTKEGAHSTKRILFHKDITGKEITGHLLKEAQSRDNITIFEYTTLVDLLCKDNICCGAIIRDNKGKIFHISADYTVLATGGVGGLYKHSTNFKHLTGDSIALAHKHGIELKDANYVQIHPTTFYSESTSERRFLISESVRGEGAKLYGKDGTRFTDELKPRDVVTNDILKQMEKDGTKFVWEDLRSISRTELEEHFPNIVAHCAENGYDVTRECIPVVPAQHYYMGGIKVNHQSKTSMEHLYAIGETACNGVHGANRLASNSLLESLVFAKRAAKDIFENYVPLLSEGDNIFYEPSEYEDEKKLQKQYMEIATNIVLKNNK